jgi:hypothetical protein
MLSTEFIYEAKKIVKSDLESAKRNAKSKDPFRRAVAMICLEAAGEKVSDN